MAGQEGYCEDRPSNTSAGPSAQKRIKLAESIFEVDRSGNFIMVPSDLERITGFSKEELELLSLKNIVFAQDQPLAMNAIESVFGGSPLTIQEVSLFSEGKGSHPVELIVLPRKIGDEVTSAWGALVDIGERSVLQDRIEALVEGQDRLKGMLKDFVNLLTREIRQPLTSILLTLELLESGQYGELPERSKEKVQSTIDMVERTKDILYEALEMSRNIGEEFRFDRQAISVREVLEDVLLTKERELSNKGIALKRGFDERQILAKADRKAMFQVFETLIDHAVSSTPRAGEISLELDICGNNIQFAISDTGHGIPDEELEVLFDRLDVDPDQENNGLSSGLRFYLAKRIVAKHGGRIWCESFVGLGSTFFFTLPVMEGGE
jgi:PAS domain S-box-containing protein